MRSSPTSPATSTRWTICLTDAERWPAGAPSREAFIAKVWRCGKAAWRDLPWRNIDDPYGVWISEVMLQQTQVSRVVGYWERFMDAFPTVDALAAADGATVQRFCLGLGYYQRFRRMKLAAETIAADLGGVMPKTLAELQALPGIGEATAAGIVAFAYNRPAIYLETNVRAVFLHELFGGQTGVTDRELRPLIAATVPERDARQWYYALLDYGAKLKGDGPNPSRASAHHHRQSAFEGSWRQKRAWLLRRVLEADEPLALEQACEEFNAVERTAGRDGITPEAFERLADELVSDGLISRDGALLWT